MSSTVLSLAILAALVFSHRFLEFKYFSAYIVVNLLQTVIGFAIYRGYGFDANLSYVVGWTTQGIVIAARALAAAQVCFLILGGYKGIWALAARLLAASGVLVSSVAIYAGWSDYKLGILTFEVGLEACIATALVGLFVFARYYRVEIEPIAGTLGFGLGLLSCFKILNDVILERFAANYSSLWNNAASGIFLCALAIWIWALARPLTVALPRPPLLTPRLYSQLMPRLNQRLVSLNDQLTHLLRVG